MARFRNIYFHRHEIVLGIRGGQRFIGFVLPFFFSDVICDYWPQSFSVRLKGLVILRRHPISRYCSHKAVMLVYLALFGGGGEEGSPLLLHLGALALGALDAALVVFGHREKQGEFLVAAQAQIFILRHADLPENSTFRAAF